MLASTSSNDAAAERLEGRFRPNALAATLSLVNDREQRSIQDESALSTLPKQLADTGWRHVRGSKQRCDALDRLIIG